MYRVIVALWFGLVATDLHATPTVSYDANLGRVSVYCTDAYNHAVTVETYTSGGGNYFKVKIVYNGNTVYWDSGTQSPAVLRSSVATFVVSGSLYDDTINLENCTSANFPNLYSISSGLGYYGTNVSARGGVDTVVLSATNQSRCDLGAYEVTTDTEYCTGSSQVDVILCSDLTGCVVTGSGGSDTVYGGSGVDYIYLDGGDDTAYGFGDSDHIFGGADNDLISLGDGHDYAYVDPDCVVDYVDAAYGAYDGDDVSYDDSVDWIDSDMWDSLHLNYCFNQLKGYDHEISIAGGTGILLASCRGLLGWSGRFRRRGR